MAQTSFNLTAIAIFVVVMMSLVGPAINLPAAIPASLTAAFLGLAAIDTLAWKGQGATLALDWIARTTGGEAYKSRIRHHEAGHFLVAVLLDIPITGYALNAWDAFRQGQPGLGGVAFDTSQLQQEISQGKLSAQTVDRYFRVWMAGIAAEQLVYGNAEGGEDDRQALRLLWQQCQRPVAEYAQKERWALLQAKTLLQTHQVAYDALVKALAEGASIQDCYATIAPLLGSS
ncbi:MAG: ATP-dependent Zn protease [Cyanobacteria bacterium]|nr:ATP-dependent Zn protease [Cyanobacteriota bacterium]MDW8201041.1 ATP-dependent Zn protease [Cyanobacteriota bacterium SKYGB_h_bin112]